MKDRSIFLSLIALAICGVSIVIILIFVALWPMRDIVALWVVGLLSLAVITHIVTHVLGQLNEQKLRRERVRYHHEQPLLLQPGHAVPKEDTQDVYYHPYPTYQPPQQYRR